MTKTESRRWKLSEAARTTGVPEEAILRFIHLEWVSPADPQERELDQEDLSRAVLIRELLEDFGANDESIPIILQLLDHIHSLHRQMRDFGSETKKFRDSRSAV